MKDFLNKISTEMHKRKKAIGVIIGAIVVLAILSIGFHAAFEVEGVVTAKTNHSITVTNFFRTQTLNLSGAPVDVANIKPGQEIVVHKSLQGKVLSIRIAGHDHEYMANFEKYKRIRH